MTKDKNNRIVPAKTDPTFFQNLAIQLKLIMRLMGDKRVSPFLKLLPIGALIYFLVPEPIPYIDDPIVVGVGSYLFVELCPPHVVAEHKEALRREVLGEYGVQDEEETPSEDFVEGEFEDMPEE
jgi:hypothetical protein